MKKQVRNFKKILVVDDSEVDLALVELYLKDKYSVLPTKSGKEALEYLLSAGKPNLIILDLIMPEMDGWETFSRIRDLGFITQVPIVFLTSVDSDKEKENAYKIGAADYILKPCNKDDINERVEIVMEKFPVVEDQN